MREKHLHLENNLLKCIRPRAGLNKLNHMDDMNPYEDIDDEGALIESPAEPEEEEESY